MRLQLDLSFLGKKGQSHTPQFCVGSDPLEKGAFCTAEGAMKVQRETRPLTDRKEIRLAMLGMVDGNGHPYSWSAMFNGYDAAEMAKCPFPVIPRLFRQGAEGNATHSRRLGDTHLDG